MKRYLFFISIIFSVFYIYAKNDDHKVKESFYKKGYSEVFTIDDSGIYASKVFDFPGVSQDELIKRVSQYFNHRLERRLSDADVNTHNFSFVDNTYIVSESSPVIKLNFAFYVYARYTYRIEIKEGKIRSTIFINSWSWGPTFPYLSPFKLYPFCSGGGYEKAFKQFYEYVKSIWKNLPKDLYSDSGPLLDDNW